jgi:hypothetical protein
MRIALLLALVVLLLTAALAQAGKRDRLLVITLTGHATATINRHQASFEETGRYRAVWLIRESDLKVGRLVPSSFSSVTGTTTATFASERGASCTGALAAAKEPLELRVTAAGGGATAFLISPSPFATATSETCPAGLSAGKWQLPRPMPGASRRQVARYAAREQAWYVNNNPGFGFTGTSYTPVAKGGNSEGFGLGFGSGGSFTWVAHAIVRPSPG